LARAYFERRGFAERCNGRKDLWQTSKGRRKIGIGMIDDIRKGNGG